MLNYQLKFKLIGGFKLMMQANQPIYDYGVFTPTVYGKTVTIHTCDITEQTIDDYTNDLKDVFLDYIEIPRVQNSKIEFIFDNGMKVRLPLSYALTNIIVWGFIIKTKQTIKPYHVFFNKAGITNSYIKKYIDKFAIIPVREKCGKDNDVMIIHNLNRVIYDTLRNLKFVDRFAWFFNNSINNEDFILMYNNCPGFKEIMDRSRTNYYSQFPADQMNAEALKDMNKLIDYIVNAKQYIGRDHCLSDAFRAKEGIKPKQAREMYTNIGVKPNGEGGIFPYVVNTNYINGGANNVAFHILESLIARIAQILSKKNTARSGQFSRIMILNCSRTKKYTIPYSNRIDPLYDCGTRNFLRYKVSDETALKKIADRYYRLNPMGMENKISNVYNAVRDNSDLIGKEIYLRSPIKCKSAAMGMGICRKCMGELYNIVPAVNIGVYSVTNLTEKLTQMMLSAKHLLEAKIDSITFDTSMISEQKLSELIVIDDGIIFINPEIEDAKKWKLIIRNGDIQEEIFASLKNDENDDGDVETSFEDMRKYINIFYLRNDSTGEEYTIKTSNIDNFYLSDWLLEYIEIKNLNDSDEDIVLPVSNLIGDNYPLFDIDSIHNDDMSERLESVIKVINLKANTDSYTAETFLEALSDRLNNIGLDGIMSVHLEIIIMNQIRSSDDIIEMPDWSVPNQNNYQILTLKKSIITHPSISISLQSEDIARMLYTPLSFRKTSPSAYDLLYMAQPQKFLASEPVIKSEGNENKIFTYMGD